jgi:hypothetical protein
LQTQTHKKTFYRIAIQRIAGLACLEGAKYLHDHKTFLHTRLQNLHFFSYFFSLRTHAKKKKGEKGVGLCSAHQTRMVQNPPTHAFFLGGISCGVQKGEGN